MTRGPCFRRVGGVSLLELLLVTALAALAITLVAAAYGGGLDGVRIRASAKEVAAQLRYARAQALAKGEMQRFEIDPKQRRWRGVGNREGRFPQALEVGFIGAREVQPRTGTGAIVFFADGGSTGGSVRLRSRGASWQVDVAWLTGEVSLSRPPVEGRQ